MASFTVGQRRGKCLRLVLARCSPKQARSASRICEVLSGVYLRLIPLTQVTATVGLAADLKAAEDESNPWPPKMADHAFGFLCWSPTGQEVEKSGKE